MKRAAALSALALLGIGFWATRRPAPADATLATPRDATPNRPVQKLQVTPAPTLEEEPAEEAPSSRADPDGPSQREHLEGHVEAILDREEALAGMVERFGLPGRW